MLCPILWCRRSATVMAGQPVGPGPPSAPQPPAASLPGPRCAPARVPAPPPPRPLGAATPAAESSPHSDDSDDDGGSSQYGMARGRGGRQGRKVCERCGPWFSCTSRLQLLGHKAQPSLFLPRRVRLVLCPRARPAGVGLRTRTGGGSR